MELDVPMTSRSIVSRGEWIEARKRLLTREKELTRERERLNAERRALPVVRLDKEYTFDGPAGPASLLDLFDGRRQLIVYHFMFHPDWEEGCPSCSFLTDNIGHLAHLHAANTTLALVSRAPVDKIEAYKHRMEWDIPWYSSHASDFNYDFHSTLDPSVVPAEYNYRDQQEIEARMGPIPAGGVEVLGASVFYREGNEIFHTYSTYARGVELLLGTFNFLDLTPLGRQEEEGTMNWLRRHDQYEGKTQASVPADD